MNTRFKNQRIVFMGKATSSPYEQLTTPSDAVADHQTASNDGDESIFTMSSSPPPYKSNPTKLLIIRGLVCSLIFAVGLLIGWLISSTDKSHSTDPSVHVIGPMYNTTFSRHLQSLVQLELLMKNMEHFAASIHRAGSERNNLLAKEVAQQWRSWGWPDVHEHPFSVLLPEPVEDEPYFVQLVGKTSSSIVYNVSTTLNAPNGSVLTTIYHAFSASGQVESADYIYIHYGRIMDLTQLESLGMNLCGSKKSTSDQPLVLLARLGFGERNQKVKDIEKYCHQRNASLPNGLLLYPDPQDFAQDGVDSGHVFPNSWWLPGDAPVWGGMRNSPRRGDFRTPGMPSLNGSYPTGSLDDAFTPFPVQPISYDDARVLLRKLDGPAVPKEWQGSLATHVGPSNSVHLRMRIKSRLRQHKLVNVVAVMPGSSLLLAPQTVVVGNHRDAWLWGASDPVSGTVILMEVARILGQAYSSGSWRPQRTLILANWDGEEFGLLGSSEFVNLWRPLVLHRTVAYLNMDCPVKGDFGLNVRADPLLRGLALDAAKTVDFNETATLYDSWTETRPLNPHQPKEGPRVSLIGGSSDHVVFSGLYAVPSIYPEWTYRPNSVPDLPAYHTRYDTVEYMRRVLDPSGLRHHVLLTRLVVDVVLRLLDSPLVPYDLDALTRDLARELNTVQHSTYFQPLLARANVTLDAVLLAMKDVQTALPIFQAKCNQTRSSECSLAVLQQLNEALLVLPRTFLHEQGLPQRPYMHNILFATLFAGRDGGTAVLTGLKDALQDETVPQKVVWEQVNALHLTLTMVANVLKGGWNQGFET